MALIATGDVSGAAEEFDLLTRQFPGSAWIDDALLERAQLHARAGESLEAQQVIERLLTDFPRTEGAAGADVLLVQLQRNEATTLEQIETLREAALRVPLLYGRDAFPQLHWRAAAIAVAGELALELGDPAGAAGHFGLALHDAATLDWQQRARIGLARSLLATDDWLGAAQVLQPAAAVVDDGGSRAMEARRLMGLIHRARIRTQGGERPWVTGRTMRSAGSAFDRPIGVAASRRGDLLIADEGVPFVAGIDMAGEVLWQKGAISARGHPWFGNDGTAFVPTDGGVIEPVTRERISFVERRREKAEPITKIVAGARGLFGEWILVHDDGDRVSIFDRNRQFVRSQTPGARARITDVEVDAQGTIYLLDRREGRVFRYSSAGQALGLAAQGSWKRAEALALDALGNLYVLDRDAKRVDVFDASGQRIAQLGPGLPGGISLDDPRDLAVDSSGRLFIADRRLSVVAVLE